MALEEVSCIGNAKQRSISLLFAYFPCFYDSIGIRFIARSMHVHASHNPSSIFHSFSGSVWPRFPVVYFWPWHSGFTLRCSEPARSQHISVLKLIRFVKYFLYVDFANLRYQMTCGVINLWLTSVLVLNAILQISWKFKLFVRMQPIDKPWITALFRVKTSF